MTTNDDATRFLVEHHDTIRRAAQYNAQGGLDADDLEQEIALRVITRLSSYDPTRGGPGTWIRWQARDARAKAVRRRRRALREIPASGTVLDGGCAWLDSFPDPQAGVRTERHAEIALLVQRADAGQKQALLVVAQGLSQKESQVYTGVTRQALGKRLNKLRRKLDGDEDRTGAREVPGAA